MHVNAIKKPITLYANIENINHFYKIRILKISFCLFPFLLYYTILICVNCIFPNENKHTVTYTYRKSPTLGIKCMDLFPRGTDDGFGHVTANEDQINGWMGFYMSCLWVWCWILKPWKLQRIQPYHSSKHATLIRLLWQLAQLGWEEGSRSLYLRKILLLLPLEILKNVYM